MAADLEGETGEDFFCRELEGMLLNRVVKAERQKVPPIYKSIPHYSLASQAPSWPWVEVDEWASGDANRSTLD